MADYVYVGRTRHRAKVGLYQVLTLGVYGRVWMYKLLREFDGHEALFLDRRPYVPLLILPIVGPFFVKRRIAILVEEILGHDVTGPSFRRGRALLMGLLPLVPLFHLYVQRAVNHHWKMHTKQEELELKRAQLAQWEKRRTAEAQAEAKTLAKEVALREKELSDLRSAALALREAESIRRKAERESGIRRGPFAAVKNLGGLKLRRGRAPAAVGEEPAEEPLPEQEPEAPSPRRGRRKPEPPPEPEPPAEDAAEPSAEPEAPPARRGLFARFLPKRGPAGEASAKGEKGGLSKQEIKELRAKAKRERQEAKAAAKEAKRRAKEKAKADKAEAKEARRKENARLKEQRKAEKAKAKERRQAEKERARAKSEDKAASGPKGKKEKARPKKAGARRK